MAEKPISIREAIPWMIPLALIGTGAGIAVCIWMGWIGNVLVTPFIVGITAAFSGLLGLKIADIRRRARP